MEQEIYKKLIELEEKINRVYISVEKTRKYFMWSMILTISLFVLPLIASIFIVPSFISNYTSNLSGLGL
jgi:hypothetical protein